MGSAEITWLSVLISSDSICKYLGPGSGGYLNIYLYLSMFLMVALHF